MPRRIEKHPELGLADGVGDTRCAQPEYFSLGVVDGIYNNIQVELLRATRAPP